MRTVACRTAEDRPSRGCDTENKPNTIRDCDGPCRAKDRGNQSLDGPCKSVRMNHVSK